MPLPRPVRRANEPARPPIAAPRRRALDSATTSQLAQLVRQSRRDHAFRARLARDPVGAARKAGFALNDHENAAMRKIGPTVFALSDNELERRTRCRQQGSSSCAHDTTAQRLIAYRTLVTELTRDVLDRTEAPQPLRQLFRRSLDEGEVWALMAPCLPAIDFPAAVAGCIAGGADDGLERAYPVSVAGLLYYLGISMADDVIDHEVEDNWGSTPGEHITMAGIALFAGLPMQAIRSLYGENADSARLCACYKHFERACYQMSVGQYMDVAADFSSSTTIADCQKIVALKTGSTGELMAALAATLAGLPKDTVERLGTTCKYLYMSMQIASDIHDIWSKPISPDLGNGIVTLPTLYSFHVSSEDDRAVYKAKLRSGDWTTSGHSALRQYITSTGGLCFSLLQAEALRQRALAAWSGMIAEPEGREIFEYMFHAAEILD